MKEISLKPFTGLAQMIGAGAGKTTLVKLVSHVAEIGHDELWILNFEGVEFATASFFREAFRNFRDYVRASRTSFVVFANASETTVEDAQLLAEATGDAFVFAKFDGTNLCDGHVVGRLEPRLAQTLELVIRLGEADAKALSDNSGDSAVVTVWNNRLVALEGKGIIVERRDGRTKRYRPILEGMRYGN